MSLVTKFETIRASARELYIWVYCVAMFVIIFGTFMYYAERWGIIKNHEEELDHVQDAGEQSKQLLRVHPTLDVVGRGYNVHSG